MVLKNLWNAKFSDINNYHKSGISQVVLRNLLDSKFRKTRCRNWEGNFKINTRRQKIGLTTDEFSSKTVRKHTQLSKLKWFFLRFNFRVESKQIAVNTNSFHNVISMKMFLKGRKNKKWMGGSTTTTHSPVARSHCYSKVYMGSFISQIKRKQRLRANTIQK